MLRVPGATAPILSLLTACARASSEAAAAVTSCPRLLDTLAGLLSAAAPGPGALPEAVAAHAARPQLMALLRLLCQSGREAADALHAAGLLAMGQAQLAISLGGPGGSAAAAGSAAEGPGSTAQQAEAAEALQVDHLLTALEALRLWAAAAQQGISLMGALPPAAARGQLAVHALAPWAPGARS